MDCYYQCTQIRCFITLVIFFIVEFYSHVIARRNVIHGKGENVIHDKGENDESGTHYKYQLGVGLSVEMEYDNGCESSYHWFMSMKSYFKHLGEKERVIYAKNTPTCKVDETTLESIKVIKNETSQKWLETQNRDVKLGGYYAPRHCRAAKRVAVIVPYRDRQVHLGIFLRHMHSLLKKQLLEYRIFVIEQYGTERFNKGTLYNIAFLETQRFGTWDCLIFHDVDLVPEDERISYSCPEHPTHMAAAVESYGYVRPPYRIYFGGVIAITPEDYRKVNGYSNFYWNWGAEDDDFYIRMKSNNLVVSRYNSSIARYATLAHPYTKLGKERHILLMLSKIRYRKEGLGTTKYKLLTVTEKKLYTLMLADVNPAKMKLDMKSIVQSVVQLHGKAIVLGQNEFMLSNPGKLEMSL